MKKIKNQPQYENKRILKPQDFKPSFDSVRIEGILNPGAIRMPNNDIILYVRVSERPIKKSEGGSPIIVEKEKYKFMKMDNHEIVGKNDNIVFLRDGICRLLNISHLRSVILDPSGFEVKKINQKPAIMGLPTYSNMGVEDPRIVKIKNKYYMTYVSVSTENGVSTSLAVSKDLLNWKRNGIIFRVQNKDVVLFPEKINGKFIALHRPEGFFHFDKPSIWISYSKDAAYWGKEKSIVHPREGGWDSLRIGAGCPPIKTEKGWLVIYHGVGYLKNRIAYSAGSFLLDLKNPEKVIARTPKDKAFIEPIENYEKTGYVKNVVFPTGIVPDLDGKHVLIYSGGADKYVSVKKILISDLLGHMEYY
jgi:beta-1,2-mannobiose phosphorylase / 1,2-beta-oligomannan phosphorylase